MKAPPVGQLWRQYVSVRDPGEEKFRMKQTQVNSDCGVSRVGL